MSENNAEYLETTPWFRRSRWLSLYSDFSRFREINPEGYAANIDAWRHLLPKLVRDKRLVKWTRSCLILDWNAVVGAVVLPNLGAPKELQLVLESLTEDRTLVPMQWYLKEGLKGDTFYQRLTLWWTRLRVRWTEDQFVCGEEVRSVSAKIYEQKMKVAVEGGKVLYSKKLLMQMVEEFGISSVDLAVILVHWSKDMKYCVVEGDVTEDNCYIKFDNSEVSETDKSVIDLTNHSIVLQQQIAEVESKIKLIDTDIRSNIIDYNKDELKKLKVTNLLQLKHLMMRTLSKYLETSKLVHALMLKLGEASSNLEMVSMLESSNKALAALNSQVDLPKLEALQEDIDDNIDRTNQISDMMVAMTDVDSDDQEIEDELQKLVEEQEAVERKKEEETLSRLEELKLDGVKDLGPDKEAITTHIKDTGAVPDKEPEPEPEPEPIAQLN